MYCTYCWNDQPRFTRDESTRRLIRTRFPLISSSEFYGLYLFTKSGIVQNVLHKIKYKGRRDIAHKLGSLISKELSEEVAYDTIIPVPMHKNKRLKRGYNQAEEFAIGIGDESGIPIQTNILTKTVNTASQTKMDRISRRMNIEKAYELSHPIANNFKKILLVDDVVTSGATLEVCSDIIKKAHSSIEIDYAFIALSV